MKLESVSLKIVLIGLLTIVLCFAGGTIAWAAIPKHGIRCMGCHKDEMGGELQDQYQGPEGCVTCHSSSTSSTTYELDLGGGIGETITVPVVYFTGGSLADNAPVLAAGNFCWVAQGYDDNGHNVVHLGNPDDVLDGPPGPIDQSFHDELIVNDSNLTCAGENGCHGTKRMGGLGSGIPAVEGAHHGNVDGICDTADSVSNSYRFLFGVMGLENTTDRWRNVDAFSHNEYYGATTPPVTGCYDDIGCHLGPDASAMPLDNTVSGFCATCHGNFHTLSGDTTGPGVSDAMGIGSDKYPPFWRHPSDIDIKNQGEYAVENRAYNVQAPVGRTTVPDDIITGASDGDVVMCLSCHAAHGSPYPNMLRWDFSGCLNCHTNK